MKKRLDILLVEKGLLPSREKAQAFIMEGKVLVDKKPITKAGTLVEEDVILELLEEDKYVSRAGYKLENALKDFNLNIENAVCLDIGSSTGGFCDCLIQRADLCIKTDSLSIASAKILKLSLNSIIHPINIIPS